MSALQKVVGLTIAGMALLLSACLTQSDAPTVPAAQPATQGAAGDTQSDAPPSMLLPEGGPTQAINSDLQFLFTTYDHPSNVFRISLPETWIVRDDSTDDRVLVLLEPPLGFASRITIDVTFEGELTFDEMDTLTNGYLILYYGNNDSYTEINRADLPDGSLQVTQLYNNPAGVGGRETANISNVGSYFAVLRAFTSDSELVALTPAIEQIVDSFTINPTARWGQPPAEVDVAELQLQGVNGWTDGEGNYWVMGRIFNGATGDVEFMSVTAGVCDQSGAVLGEGSSLLVNDVLPQGGVVSFAIKFGPVAIAQPRPCLLEAAAEPAGRISEQTYTQFDVTHSASYDANAEEPLLSIGGVVTNVGDQAVSLIDIIIAIYNAPDGNVIGYAITTTEAIQLLSGDTSFFGYEFTAGELGAGPETSGSWIIELWVQGNPIEVPLESSLTPTLAPTP